MKYKCRHCNFIHFGSMPDGYICPLCHAGLFDFDLIDQSLQQKHAHQQYNQPIL